MWSLEAAIYVCLTAIVFQHIIYISKSINFLPINFLLFHKENLMLHVDVYVSAQIVKYVQHVTYWEDIHKIQLK